MRVRRYHLFELEDQPWFPGLIRDFMTDYLHLVSERFGIFEGAAPVLVELLERTGRSDVLDLGSGGGGPWRSLAPTIRAEVPELSVTLSDLFPNQAALTAAAEGEPSISVSAHPVDAMAVPEELGGVRTQFLALHHFRPEDAVRIVGDAVAKGTPIAVFEAQKRDFKHLFQFALSPIAVLLMTPLVRPLKLSRFLFTYLIPIVPLCVLWDGVVSVLRTYSRDELLDIAGRADPSDSFEWEVGESTEGPSTLVWLVGSPGEVE